VTAHLTVTRPGISAVTDLGRSAGGRYGQMTGGAMDQYSAKVANALVASAPDSPLIEVFAMDFAAVATTDLLVAVTGAPADVKVADVLMPQWEPFLWPAGTELVISGLRTGLRTYLAVHGRVHADQLLGSCAPDSVLGFSGSLSRGQRVPVDPSRLLLDHPYFGIPVFQVGPNVPVFADQWEIPVTDGPDRDQFGSTADRLFRGSFQIGDKSNHIGLRLSPASSDAALPVRATTGEILSRGVPVGAVEVPAGNELLILHRGRGVTAGYPVLSVVTAIGLDRLGQARPGQTASFTRVSVEQAVADARAREQSIVRLRQRVAAVLETYGLKPLSPAPAPIPARA
jgi:allophanate hydrolase subunit 2